MPMVNESSLSPVRNYTVAKTGVSSSLFPLLCGRQRSQSGFRSRELTEEEAESLRTQSTSGNVLSLIKVYDDLDDAIPSAAYGKHSSRVWPVNDRTYTETKYRPTGFNMSYTMDSFPYGTGFMPRTYQGALGFTGVTASVMPGMPSDVTIQSMAAKMLRESRPPKAGFNLARFAMEQREAPLLMRAANYMPRSKKELGGAYLNFMFGLKPTGSDLGQMAELVLRADSGIQRLLDAEKIREKKYMTRVLFEDTGGQEYALGASSTGSTGDTLFLYHANAKFAYLGNYSTSGYAAVIDPVLRYSYTRKQMLRTFATWEYYVPQPYDIRGRLASYRRGAKMLLSAAKLDESTVYELTPWTWMSNWFVDFGGLLRYQRDVVDNQIVASACGYSTWEEYTGLLHHTGLKVRSYAGSYPYWAVSEMRENPAYASIQWRRHKRRGGSPYSIMPTWSLTNQQWAITGALGLARGIGLPIKR